MGNVTTPHALNQGRIPKKGWGLLTRGSTRFPFRIAWPTHAVARARAHKRTHAAPAVPIHIHDAFRSTPVAPGNSTTWHRQSSAHSRQF